MSGIDELLAKAKVVHIQPDDLLVMKFPGVDVDPEFVQRLKTVVGDRRVLVLADDVKIGVVEWDEL